MANEIVRLVIFAVAGVLLFAKHRAIAEAIEDFTNNMRGGRPPRPMHPLPANDGAWLRRKTRRP